jgi:hypothetical protein
MDLTDRIMGDPAITSDFKKNWLRLLAHNVYVAHEHRVPKKKWLRIDDLLAANDAYAYMMVYAGRIDDRLHPWAPEARRQLAAWKEESDQLIEGFAARV